MRVALTGVPGTGKTTIAEAIDAMRVGVRVVKLNDVARAAGLLTEKDEARGAFVVDMDDLADEVNDLLEDAEAKTILLEGHFAHEMDVDAIVLLRCDPLVLVKRLLDRGWSEEKVRENVEAEALDVLAQEVLDTEIPAVELDVTSLGVEEAARQVLAIAESPPKALKGTPVGSAAWSLETLPWS